MLYGIPIYFQIASNASISESGTRIVPVVVGNAVGTLLAGQVISKFSRYKYLTILGLCCSMLCFTIMCFRWRGSASWVDSSCVFLAGFGMGTSQSTTFVHLAASLEQSEMAIAGTSWFLAQSLGSLIGASFDIALTNAVIGSMLHGGLKGFDQQFSVRNTARLWRWNCSMLNVRQIIKRVTSNLGSISKLPANVQAIVKNAYISSLIASDGKYYFLSRARKCCVLNTYYEYRLILMPCGVRTHCRAEYERTSVIMLRAKSRSIHYKHLAKTWP